MHDTARMTGKLFFECYGKDHDEILDVGSLDINGTLRDYRPRISTYVGVDLSRGPGVDFILDDSHHLPFDNDSFDLVVSTSCFEHDTFFWLNFLEMVRVARHYVYVSAPTGGVVHRHPIDAWRFYPDAGVALSAWGKHNGYDVSLVESFILPPGADRWSDFVAVWRKQSRDARRINTSLQNTQFLYSET